MFSMREREKGSGPTVSTDQLPDANYRSYCASTRLLRF